MTALPQELLERAKRHGLVRTDEGVWSAPDQPGFVGRTDGEFWWAPKGVWVGAIEIGPHYPNEESALRAALDWLDLQVPDKAWKPAPWAPVLKVLERLKALQERIAYCGQVGRLQRGSSDTMVVDTAIIMQELAQAVLGPNMASDPEQALLALIDLHMDRGQFGETLRDRLRQVLQLHPDEAIELVGDLKIAGAWDGGRRHALHHHADIGDTELVGHIYEAVDEPGWLAEVEALPLTNGVRATFPTERAAKAAVDALLQDEGYGLGGGAVLRCGRCNSDGLIGGCPDCGDEAEIVEGEGDDDEPIDCPECDGDGAVHDCGEDTCNCEDLSTDQVDCLMCGGSGQVIP